MNNWQPIETAPRDGTMLLLYEWPRTLIGNWRERKGKWAWRPHTPGVDEFFCQTRNVPSHWMDLPDPPEGMERTIDDQINGILKEMRAKNADTGEGANT